MFGEYNNLGSDLDICGINRGGFDDPSEETNYSFDAQSDASASISDDYIDTFDSESEMAEQVIPQTVAQNNTKFESESANSTENYQPAKSSGSAYLAVLLIVLLAAAGLFYYKKNVAPAPTPTNSQELGDYFYDKAVENSPEQPAAQDAEAAQQQPADTVATVDVDLVQTQPQPAVQQQQQQEEPKAEQATAAAPATQNKTADAKSTKKAIVIPVTSGGRLDPFYPFNEPVVGKTVASNYPKFDIIAPPYEIPEEDPMIDKLMEIKVTGIMYDNVRPSALIVVDGAEQLAHKGDVISEYKILNITKDKVVMKYKTNIYEVSAGQSLTPNGVHLNPVAPSSLSKQFGGAYKKTGNMINFN